MTTKTCRRCGAPVTDGARLVPIHAGKHGVACPGSGTKPLIVAQHGQRAA